MKPLATHKLRLPLCVVLSTILMIEITQAIEMSPSIQAYLGTATVTELGYPSGTEQQRTEFAAWLSENWSAILSEFDAVAPDERRQSVIVAGAELMSGTDYVSFLSGLLDKYEAGQVKRGVAISALSAEGRKIGLLAFNYQHPSVQSLCNRAKALFPNDAELQSSMTDILSGEQQKQDGAWLFMENRPEPEILPPPQ